MHYVPFRGRYFSSHSFDRYEDDLEREVRRVVEREVVPDVPTEAWDETAEEYPLQYGTDLRTITTVAFPHATGDVTKRNAVYVLECRSTSRPYNDAYIERVTPKEDWVFAAGARRRIYVGWTNNLVKRLHHHLNNYQGRGAHFTRVFPPVRLLNVSWWGSRTRATIAEPMIADLLDERFEHDYVYQL